MNQPEKQSPPGSSPAHRSTAPSASSADTQADPSEAAFEYQGGELELFQHARRWKRYWSRSVRRHIGTRVLEVGAGIGANTGLLLDTTVEQWDCLEPDGKLFAALQANTGQLATTATLRAIQGTLAELPGETRYDTILYIDVLEHIEDDRGELALAAEHLTPGGALVVLSPAQPWLFSPFDKAIGHYRRYTRASLKAITPEGTSLTRLRYLDSVGLLASLANRAMMKKAMPTYRNILLWDRAMVPCSMILDPLLAYRWGKSILAVWRAEPS